MNQKAISIIQYVLIYFALLLHGSVYFAMDKFHDLFLIVALLLDGILGTYFLIQWKKKKEQGESKFIIFWVAVAIALGISCLSNGFSLGFSSVLNILGRLAFYYLVYRLDEKHAADRVVRLCSALALISLLFYAVQRINGEYLNAIMVWCSYGNGYEGYVLPVYAFMWSNEFRNCGIYTEPGLYQIVLGSVLFLLLQGRKKLSLGKNEIYAQVIVTILALLTAGSTSGYFTLAIILGMYLFERDKGDLRTFYFWILGLGCVAVAIDLLRGENSLLYNKIIYKILNDVEGSPSARINSMKADLEIWVKYPLGAGYRNYNELWAMYLSAGKVGWDISSCVGLTKYAATAGIQTVLVLLFGYLYYLWKNYKSIPSRIAYLLFFFNVTLAQPEMIYPTLFIVLLCKDREILNAPPHTLSVNVYETSNVLGVNIAVTNMEQTLERLQKNLDAWRGKYICISNVHTTVMAYENPSYRTVQNGAVLALPDGGPLSAYSRREGKTEARRVTGPDLMREVLKNSTEHGWKHFFYGSSQETLDLLKAKIGASYPGVEIVGMISPPYRELTPGEDETYVYQINEAKPDFVWVGLGAPKQEIWMAKHEDRINAIMIGVGAAFDYESGNLKRAPEWMQKRSLEWLYRFLQEPKRLFKRYLITNLKFLWLTRR